MKTLAEASRATAAIVQLADTAAEAGDALQRARAFAEPLLAGQVLDTGESAWAHAEGVAGILRAIGAAPSMQAAAYLVYAGDYLARPEEMVNRAFGPSYASLVMLTRKLVQIQRAARGAQVGEEQQALQTERVRKMLLAFSRDLRVVLLRLASRLQSLRWFAAARQACPRPLAQESQQVFAPLANRLGIWQIKWELEDLSFRFLDPEAYHQVARLLDEKRVEREQVVEQARRRLADLLQRARVPAQVLGRPKHLYSIWKKMQGKHLSIERVFDVRALRVIVADKAACYAALARVHEALPPVDGEFDDYIARPKPNGYQSLHTVVLGDDGRPLEVQIRTAAMHEHAEHGVAAHWLYKEAGARGYAGVSASGDYEQRLAEARRAVLRELLAWERDFSGEATAGGAGAGFDDRIYVFTPQATIVEVPAGGTPVDFAYSLHTDLGHRCRGARVDGAMVPLNTPLKHGQTVEVVAAKDGGPSLDWLNAELGYLKSPRARAKVRAWFNAQALDATIARGRELVEKLLQREGRTALKLEHLAEQLGFKSADGLFEVVGKDEFSLRNIENLLRPPPPPAAEAEAPLLKRSRSGGASGGVLVVGMGSLMTALARCCRPAPPDAIGGFVTRGKGVAIHRRDCVNFRHMAERFPGREIEVQWGAQGGSGRGGDKAAVYPLDVQIEADDRQGLLRDISEVFAKERLNVIAVNTQSQARQPGQRGGALARMVFTVEAEDAGRLAQALRAVARVAGVRQARRR
ncbi:MAG: bifunctional (p)ppGpp synthetase/guanosine-3',5'-bis(diphosphate) 3'-pyrophosphohydrolase [Proteobacteria bacterium]|nr:bifunctional (p)ppGpp synthetase/guanosine-3',5'-bis(diphosphate) 3'-pyrophosphohydrolase [Pseudomonadota bacterium]